ncbi:hypothetical protein ACFC09_45035 [Streptomyces sp. NPDC056161]
MTEMTFGHVADDTVVRTGLLQTGACNLAPIPGTDGSTPSSRVRSVCTG